ncbi:MAG: CDP-2,3-bis-(O-geranylgeranyl)-sn-glycerol synthase [Candidatus Hydrothermarchaeales archaeon]
MITVNTMIIALYFFLPAYIANFFAGFGSGKPLDFGMSFPDGRRIFGDGVTIKGFFIGIVSGTISIILINIFRNFQLTADIYLAFILSSGALLGDALGSFVKRRLGMEQGESAPLLDQLDFVFGGLFTASFIVIIPLDWIIVLMLLTPLGHLTVNFVGFQLKMKEVPW